MKGSKVLAQVKRTTGTMQRNGEDALESGRSEDSEPDQVGPGSGETISIESDVDEQIANDESIDYDQLFELLKNKRRRRVLQYLLDVEEITLDLLAEQIAAEENGKDITQITSQERKRVYVGLYQCHLPKMDDWGAISYNKPRGRISATEKTELFAHYLPDGTESAESRWSEYQWGLPLGLSLVFLTSVVLGAAGLVSMPQLVAVSVVAVLASVSMLRFYR